jgi:Mor family transcriptional regulator
MSKAIADNLWRLWEGVTIYIKKTNREAQKAKDKEVYETYKQLGFVKTAKRFGLSVQRVRQIERKERARLQSKGCAELNGLAESIKQMGGLGAARAGSGGG